MISALWKGERIVEVASIFQDALESQWQCIYCLKGSSDEFSLETKESLFRIANHLPTIIALTQSIGTKAEQFQSQLVDLSLPVKGIINIMAKPYPIYESVYLPSFGLEEMLDL